MKKYKTKAFTLVELIIVITILAILATIGFMSYQSYTLDARDWKRISDLTQIRNWLEMYKAKKVTYPKHTANTTANIWFLIIQWYVDNSVLWAIKMSNDSIDPLEKVPYTYSTNTTYTKYQLLAYLENWKSLNLSSSLNKAYAVNNYNNRDEYVLWDKLWVVLDNSTNAPIQEIQTWSIDLAWTYSWTTFKLIVDNTNSWIILSTWSILETTITDNTWNKWSNNNWSLSWVSWIFKDSNNDITYPTSCNNLLTNSATFHIDWSLTASWAWFKDWVYTIDPDWNWWNFPFNVYCDMNSSWWPWILAATNWWWWTTSVDPSTNYDFPISKTVNKWVWNASRLCQLWRCITNVKIVNVWTSQSYWYQTKLPISNISNLFSWNNWCDSSWKICMQYSAPSVRWNISIYDWNDSSWWTFRWQSSTSQWALNVYQWHVWGSSISRYELQFWIKTNN